MPHAGVVRAAVLRRQVRRAQQALKPPGGVGDDFMTFGVPFSTYFPVDLR
jgi:hypothetical protein